MCIAEPGKVVKIDGKTMIVEYAEKKIGFEVSLVNGLKKGDYVLAHGDLIIQKLDKDDAMETLELIREIGHAH